MAQITGAIASSHAFAFLDPSSWDARRAQMFDSYERRYGERPADRPEVQAESDEDNRRRYQGWLDVMGRARQWLHDSAPDVLVVVGDDQNENLIDVLPQFAVYTGGDFVARHAKNPSHDGGSFFAAQSLAADLARGTVQRGFDTAAVARFTDDALLSHAHREPLEFLQLDGHCAVLPVFVDAVHVPAPSPARCMDFGQALGEAIAKHGEDLRVALYASGGLSHFTAGYPWRDYTGDATPGAIAADFDRNVVEAMREGRADDLRSLTSEDLLANGDVELRAALVMLGALDSAAPTELLYEPFYRGCLGMVAGYWDVD